MYEDKAARLQEQAIELSAKAETMKTAAAMLTELSDTPSREIIEAWYRNAAHYATKEESTGSRFSPYAIDARARAAEWRRLAATVFA